MKFEVLFEYGPTCADHYRKTFYGKSTETVRRAAQGWAKKNLHLVGHRNPMIAIFIDNTETK
jgi:hypothetical protein